MGKGSGTSKRSGRDESTWVVAHLYMEAMLGISLYSYPYLNYQKCFVFLIIAYVFSSTKLVIRVEQGLHGSKWGWGGEGGGEGQGVEWLNECTCE
jgi:hypothetical protein